MFQEVQGILIGTFLNYSGSYLQFFDCRCLQVAIYPSYVQYHKILWYFFFLFILVLSFAEPAAVAQLLKHLQWAHLPYSTPLTF